MPEDENKKSWLPKINFNKRILKKQIRQVEGATIRHTHKFITKRLDSVREAQRHIITWVLIVGILISATGLQLMWFRQNYKLDTGTIGGVYAEAVLGPIETLNPLFAKTSAEQSAGYLLFSNLVRYDKTGHLGYDVAKNIKTNNEKTVYTVMIRDDIKWHDGQKLTVNDIDFTIGLIKNPNVRTSIEGWSGIGVKVIDDYNIEFNLNSPYSAFEHLLNFPILPRHILKDVMPSGIRENSFSNNPIGSGPFKFNFYQDVDLKTGHKIVYLEKNTEYYKGQAKIDKFQLHSYSTVEEIRRSIINGEVNAAADLYPVDLKNIDKNKYNTESNPVNIGVYAILNTTNGPLQDVSLRRALQVGTDTDGIRADLPITTPSLDLPVINSQLSGDLPKAPRFDLDAANKTLNDLGWVLNAAGLREKADSQLKLKVVTVKNSELERVLEIVTGQWRALGIAVETSVIDPDDKAQNLVQNILQPRSFDVLLYRLNIGADPDVYAYWHSSQATAQGFNFSNYSNVISDDALLSARVRFDPVLRNAKYLTFSRQWLSDVPAIGLYQSTAQYISTKNVDSVNDENILISSIDRYATVLDWTVGSRSVYKTP